MSGSSLVISLKNEIVEILKNTSSKEMTEKELTKKAMASHRELFPVRKERQMLFAKCIEALEEVNVVKRFSNDRIVLLGSGEVVNSCFEQQTDMKTLVDDADSDIDCDNEEEYSECYEGNPMMRMHTAPTQSHTTNDFADIRDGEYYEAEQFISFYRLPKFLCIDRSLQQDRVVSGLVKTDSTFLLYVRPCFPEVYDLMMQRYSSEEALRFVVNGIPGVGKSEFVLYFLWRFLNDSPQCGGFVFEDSSGSGKRLFQVMVGSPTTEISAWDRNHQIPYIIDARVADNSVALGKVTLVLPHANEAKYFMLLTYSPAKLTLPVWSIPEVRAACKVFPQLNLEVVRELFEWFGGVPRFLFMDRTRALQVMRAALDRWAAFLAQHYYSHAFGLKGEDAGAARADELMYVLVHLNPAVLATHAINSKNGVKYDLGSEVVTYTLASQRVQQEVSGLLDRVGER